jgi:hypothetical protein
MHSRANRHVCAVSIAIALAYAAGGQTIHGGAQVTMIARMPDTLTVRPLLQPAAAPLASPSTASVLQLNLSGRLLPGANVTAACAIHTTSIAPQSPTAPASPNSNSPLIGSLTCNGKFIKLTPTKLAPNDTPGVILNFANRNTSPQAQPADSRLDISLSII